MTSELSDPLARSDVMHSLPKTHYLHVMKFGKLGLSDTALTTAGEK